MHLAYLRVSTLEQSISRQEQILADYTKREGIIIDETYSEKISGGVKNRPELTALLKAMRAGDHLYCASLDRLARSLIHLQEIASQCREKGVYLHLIKEGQVLDPSGSNSLQGLLFSVLGAFAEFERAVIRERQAEGIAAAKAKGVKFGRKISATHEQIAAWRKENKASQKATAQHFSISLATVKRACSTSTDGK